jgi:Adenylate cyclase, family 3 (some proteins contain HAMP domain)
VTVVGDLTGEGAAQERAAIGETPNLAARLQTLAEPGTVLICPSTRRLTGGYFDYRDVGPLTPKGWGGAGTGLAGGGGERCGEPLRGNAQYQTAASLRA